MKKWYKGEIKVLFDADNKLSKDIDTEVAYFSKYMMHNREVYIPIKDVKISTMEETDDEVEE